MAGLPEDAVCAVAAKEESVTSAASKSGMNHEKMRRLCPARGRSEFINGMDLRKMCSSIVRGMHDHHVTGCYALRMQAIRLPAFCLRV